MATATLQVPERLEKRMGLRNRCYLSGQRLDAAQCRTTEAAADVEGELRTIRAIDPELHGRLRACHEQLRVIADELAMAVNVMDTHRLTVEGRDD